MEGQRQNNISEEKEIDLLALGKKIWLKKKFILKVVGIAFILGLVVAFSIPKEYKTSVILVPDTQTSGTMGSLAALAGINLNSMTGTDALASPDLYPDIINSSPFLQGLFDIPVIDADKNIDTTLYSYLNDHQSAAWWSYILNAGGLLKKQFSSNDKNINMIKAPNSRFISQEKQNVLNNLKSRLTINSDKKTGVITLEIIMQSPEISAYIADTLTSYLQAYVINYRTQKARNDLAYAEKLYEESKINYYKAQKALATFTDGNLNVVSAQFGTTQERLQNESNLAFSVYNQTAQQVQMAKLKVQNTTPVFTVIQPAVKPLQASKPSKKIILVCFMFLSLLGASLWTLRNDLFDISNRNEEADT